MDIERSGRWAINYNNMDGALVSRLKYKIRGTRREGLVFREAAAKFGFNESPIPPMLALFSRPSLVADVLIQDHPLPREVER